MIPEFKVILTQDKVIEIEFPTNVPHELAVWLKEHLLENFEGSAITPTLAQQIGDYANSVVMQLVTQGTLYKDLSGNWKLKDRLIEWSNPNES